MLGSTILHYQIVDKIGAGGMGEIYKARDARLNRFVAIKVLSPGVARDEERRRRFFQEAQAASALNHPNIITIYDIISDGPVECIVMEYVSGKTLADLIPPTGMSAALVVRLGVQTASALNVAHTAGIVHRDLKPGNIMVTESALVKVLDFGLAKLLDAGPVAQSDETRAMGQPMTIEGSIIGTVSYMSPEQAQGKRIDARTDIFSFGTVLYEMATGKRAFEGDNTLSTLTAVLRDEIRPVADFVPNSPPEFDEIIQRCMRKNPDDRYQSMHEVEVALGALKKGYDSGNFGAAPASLLMTPMAGNPQPPSIGMQPTQAAMQPPSLMSGPPSMSAPPAVAGYPPQGGYPTQQPPLYAQQPPAQMYPPQGQQPPSMISPPPPSGGPAAAPQAQQANGASTKKKGSPLALIAGIMVLLGAIGGGVWFFLNKDQAKAPEQVAQNAPPAVTPQPATPDPATQPPPTPVVETPPVPEKAPEKAPEQKAAQKTPAQKAADQKAAQKQTDQKAAGQKSAPTPAPEQPKPTQPQKQAEVKPAVPVPVPVAAPTRSVPVPDGTPFSITLVDDIPADAEEGTTLRFIATQDLKAGGAVVIAKGATITGAIFEGKKKKVLGIGGKMTLRMLQATTVDGHKVNVRATAGTRGDGPARRSVEVPGSKPKDLAAAKGAEYVAYIDGEVTVSVKQ